MTFAAPRILALFQAQPHWSASQEEIQRSLKTTGPERHQLHAALGSLVQQGQLEKDGQRYRLTPTVSVSKPSHSMQASQNSRSGSHSRNAERPGGSPTRHASAGGNSDHRGSFGPPRMAGTFTAHPDGYGFVWVGDLRDSLFIPPRENLGALDGDWVSVEEVPSRTHRTSGRITAVLERRRFRARGHVEREHGDIWVVPLNLRVPDIFIEPAEGDPVYASGALVDVDITEYPRDPDDPPAGRITGIATVGDSPDDYIETILANSTLHQGFSKATLAQVSAANISGMTGQDVLAQARREGRTDLTERAFVTVDPENARDFDDAVFLDRAPSGRERLWVAIADVGAYVPAGSPLDEDAFAKGTSVYFPARVMPMLPEVLSNDLCSLKPDEPRLAMVVEMELDDQAAPVAVKFHEAVIRSHARLTYEQAQNVFDALPGTDIGGAVDLAIRTMLLALKGVAEKLRAKRDGRGAISFVFPEVRFELDDKGAPVRILRKYPSDATRMIEQLMLEANECVAAFCATEGLPALYRVHDAPPEDALPQVVAQLWNSRVKCSPATLRTPQGFHGVVEQLAEHPARETLELVMLKSMAQAQYREKCEPHFALAAEHYCHFTSPIRRYPDLVVHRALKAWIHRKEGVAIKAVRPDEGMYLSARERVAADVEQQVSRLYRVLYMEPHLGEEFPATVTSVAERGIGISLRDEYVEGYLPLDSLTDDAYRFDRERQVVVAKHRRQTIGFGQRLVAQLVKADRWAQRIEFIVKRWSWDAPASGERPRGNQQPVSQGHPPAHHGTKPAHASSAKPHVGKSASGKAKHGTAKLGAVKPGTAKPGSAKPSAAKQISMNLDTAKPAKNARGGGRAKPTQVAAASKKAKPGKARVASKKRR